MGTIKLSLQLFIDHLNENLIEKKSDELLRHNHPLKQAYMFSNFFF